MFAINATIVLIVIFGIIYNSIKILTANVNKSDKYFGFFMFIIMLIIGTNLVFSFITYYHTKDKIGQIGDVGIRGQDGTQGTLGKCDSSCGRKVCYGMLLDHANKVLNNELDAIIIAAAGVIRLNLSKYISNFFKVDEIVPSPLQGFIAIEAKTDFNSKVYTRVEDSGINLTIRFYHFL